MRIEVLADARCGCANGIGHDRREVPTCGACAREIFDHQAQEYRDSVLPPHIKARVAVEQGSTLGWERYVGERVVGEVVNAEQLRLEEARTKKPPWEDVAPLPERTAVGNRPRSQTRRAC